MAKVQVTLTTYISGSADVELPVGKTADDIEDVDAKWGNVTFYFKDGTHVTVNSDINYEIDTIDHKRPHKISVDVLGDNGDIIGSVALSESEFFDHAHVAELEIGDNG